MGSTRSFEDDFQLQSCPGAGQRGFSASCLRDVPTQTASSLVVICSASDGDCIHDCSARVRDPFGIANVPVNLIERVEIYRGVVPIRFGADALGGAVNLVSDQPADRRPPGARQPTAAPCRVGSVWTG